jgi:hypothetical protein
MVRFESDDSSVMDSSLPLVDNICLSLTPPSQVERKCLSFLLDDELQFWRNCPLDRGSRVKVDENCLTLEKLISNTSRNRYRPTGLTKEEHLCLAVNLTSSLLQLYGTPWLSEIWCNKSIYFSRPVNVEQPFVMIKFGNSSPLDDVQGKFGPNPYLVALGIILLELAEKKCFLEWISHRNDINPPEKVVDRAIIAREWLSEALATRTVSDDYAAVVQICLLSSFTPVQLRTTLTNESFREAVCHQILTPLENEYSIVKKNFEMPATNYQIL